MGAVIGPPASGFDPDTGENWGNDEKNVVGNVYGCDVYDQCFGRTAGLAHA